MEENRGKNRLRLFASWGAIALLITADQALKYWAVHVLRARESMDFLRIGSLDILGLRYLENTGAAFGSFAGMRWVLIGVTAVLCGVCIVLLHRHAKDSRLLQVSLTLIIAGGIGNMIDRLFRGGAVVDYLEVRLFRFAIFNFADCCVVIGVAILLIYLVFFSDRKKASREEMDHGK